jgi:hypothetical protein
VRRIRAGLTLAGLVAAMGVTAAIGGRLLFDAIDTVELPRRCDPGDSCAPLLHADDFAAGRVTITMFQFPEHEGTVPIGYRVESHVDEDRALAVADVLVVGGDGAALECSVFASNWLHVPAGGDAVLAACREPERGGRTEVRFEDEAVAVAEE